MAFGTFYLFDFVRCSIFFFFSLARVVEWLPTSLFAHFKLITWIVSHWCTISFIRFDSISFFFMILIFHFVVSNSLVFNIHSVGVTWFQIQTDHQFNWFSCNVCVFCSFYCCYGIAPLVFKVNCELAVIIFKVFGRYFFRLPIVRRIFKYFFFVWFAKAFTRFTTLIPLCLGGPLFMFLTYTQMQTNKKNELKHLINATTKTRQPNKDKKKKKLLNELCKPPKQKQKMNCFDFCRWLSEDVEWVNLGVFEAIWWKKK